MGILNGPMNSGSGGGGGPAVAIGVLQSTNGTTSAYSTIACDTFQYTDTVDVVLSDTLTLGGLFYGVLSSASAVKAGIVTSTNYTQWNASYGKSFASIAVNTAGSGAAGPSLDLVYKCTATLTFTLPNATVANVTKNRYTVKNSSGGGTITIATTVSQTVDGAAPVALTGSQARTYYSDGANWIIIGGIG